MGTGTGTGMDDETPGQDAPIVTDFLFSTSWRAQVDLIIHDYGDSKSRFFSMFTIENFKSEF